MPIVKYGAAWPDADPGTGFPWYNNHLPPPAGGLPSCIDIVFHYAKMGSAQEYVKIQWKTDAGTVSLQAFDADGWASFVKMFKFPTWTSP